jgi:hypothetical protein
MKRGLLDALNRSERRSADPIDIAARELHQLCVATELMEGMFQELRALSESDAVLRLDLVTERPAISAQLAELRALVSRMSSASNINDDVARAKALLGPLSRSLDTLAQGFEARNS